MAGAQEEGKELLTSKEKARLVEETICGMKSIGRQIFSYQERLMRGTHMTFPSFFIVNYLYENGPLHLSNLARLTGVSRPTITSIADTLEGHGIVTRIRDKKDRRSVAISLSDDGTKILEKVQLTKDEIMRELAKELSDEQFQSFVVFLGVFKRVIAEVFESKIKELEEADRDFRS